MDTLGIYVQIPFCPSKCTFCNFSSKVASPGLFDAYCVALEKEIAGLPSMYAAKEISPRICEFVVDTLYFGGGTPSLLGIKRLQRLVNALCERFRFTADPEFTIEVTPASVDDPFARSVLACGINRLSIGAQSFDDGELDSVGRLHSSSDTRELVRIARRAGFTNVSLDLIAGLPHQTEASWRASVRATIELEPEHISLYLFEIDDKSRLGGEVLREGNRYHAAAVPDDDFMADCYETGRALLMSAGYVQYEISNFARPGFESRHNRKYWQRKPYIGLGAGAHSFDGVQRWSNETAVESYEEQICGGASPIEESHVLSTNEKLEEFFFLGLRQKNGVDVALARRQWGQPELQRWEAKLSRLVREGRIEQRGDRVSLSDSAYLVSNEVFQEFLVA